MLIGISNLGTLGFFLCGIVFGGVILLFTVKRTEKNLKDPWEEFEEEEELWENEKTGSEENSQQEYKNNEIPENKIK